MAETAKKRLAARAPGAGRNGNMPPVEHRFQPGNKVAVGKGKPHTITELRQHIQAIGEQRSATHDLTRLDVLLRQMFGSKNAGDRATILKYGWGNVPQPIGGSTELGPVQIEVVEAFDYGAAVAAIAARPDQDRADATQDSDGSDWTTLG